MKKRLLNSLKVITILLLTASSNHLFAVCQSLIVNGGFETGDFTGWVPLHGTRGGNNNEHIANDVPSFTTGNYALELSFFVQVDSGTTSSAYQQVNVPAYGGILSFNCMSFYTMGTPFTHQTRVYITDVNNNVLAIVAQDTFVPNTTYNISYNLAPVAGRTVRIVFEEQIDFPGSLNKQTISDFFLIDNVSIYGIATSQTVTFCAPPFNVTVGSVTHTQPGVYVDTLFGASVAGCDSVVTTTVNYQPLRDSQAILYCYGSPISYSIGTHTYTATGTYTDTLLSGSCDSIVTTTIAYRPVPAFGQAFYLCDSGSVTVAGVTHYATSTTTFIDTLFGASMYGCDSLITTVVGIGHTPAPAPQLGNLTLCNGSVSSKISFNLADTTTFAGWRSSNPSIGLTSHGADTIPAFTAVNSGNVPVTDTITVTVKGRGYAWFPSGPWLIKYDIARHIVVDTINMPHSDIALQCAFSPDGSVVYVYSRQTGTEYRSVYAFSASTDQLVRTYPYRDQINDYHQGEMCISPDGQYLYVASSFDNLNLFIINTVTGAVKSNIVVAQGDFYGLCISPDGNKLYAAGSLSICEIDAHADTLIRAIPTGYVSAQVAISPDGKTLFSSFSTNATVDTVYVFEVASGNIIASMPTGPGEVCGYFFTPDSTKLGVFNSLVQTGSANATVFDLKTYTQVNSPSVSSKGVPAIIVGAQPADNNTALLNCNITPDGRELFSQGADVFLTDPFGFVRRTYPVPASGQTIPILYDDPSNHAGSQGSFMDAGHCLSQEMTFTITVYPTARDTQQINLCTGNTITVGTHTYSAAGTYTDTLYNGSVHGCDSIITTQITMRNAVSSLINANICNGSNYAGHTGTGIYVDHYNNMYGCDSARTLNLTVIPNVTSTISASICQGSNYAGHTTSGNYLDHYTSAAGCDSARTLNLTVKDTTTSNTSLTICSSQLPYVWNGLTFNTAGSQTATGFTNAAGCDSTATLNLTVNPVSSSVTSLSICSGNLPYSWNGLTFNAAGSQTAHLTNRLGCDSSATLNLTVSDTSHYIFNYSICASALPLSWNNIMINGPGTYTATGFTNIYGCDSTATMNFTTRQATSSITNITICDTALPYTWNGLVFTSAGTQTKTGLINAVSCDSTATLNLTVVPTSSTTNLSICQSQLPYVWNGLTFNASGSQTKTGYTNIAGCDSSATLNLTVNTATTSATDYTICQSALPYVWNGLTFTGAGTQTKTGLTNAAGCDSTATLTLTVNAVSSSTTNLAICADQLPYTWNGLTFTGAGSQTKTGLATSLGCDSSATLNLTVNQPSQSTTSTTICQAQLPYVWNGLTFTAAGSQTKTGLTNAAGCDSTATLNLTVNASTASSTNLAVCAAALPYSWNGLTFTAAGSQTKTGLTNAAGCDSTATLNLTVNTATSSNTNYTLCQSALPYVWNGLTFTAAGSQTATGFTNVAGCDSTATLNLTVNTISASTTNLAICAAALPYTWNGLTFTAAGSQTKTGLTTSLGCDSTATLNLTVNAASSSTTSLSICSADLPYNWNGLTFTSTGSQTATGFTNALGCDSTATLNLTVNTIDSTINVHATVLTANQSGATYQWLDCSNNQPISGATSVSYTATVTGDYAVAITKSNCSDTSQCIHVIVNGLQNINGFNAAIEVYPNPNNGSFIVRGASAGTYTITNELGQNVKTFSLTSADFTLNVNDLSSGVYFVAFKKDAETFTQKVVVLK